MNKLISKGSNNAKTSKNSLETHILYLMPFTQNSKGLNLCTKANANGTIIKYYSNGDSVDCGEIKLNGSNKTYAANTKQRIRNY
jgi:hypothetical protein